MRQALVNLQSRTVNHYQSHPQAVQQGDVVDDGGEVFMLRGGAPQHQHEGLAPVCIDVGCGVSQPANVIPPLRCHVCFQAIDKCIFIKRCKGT